MHSTVAVNISFMVTLELSGALDGTAGALVT
jgi:hypothetical protein